MGSWSFILTPAPHPRPLSPQGSGGHVPWGSVMKRFWEGAPLRIQVPFPQAFGDEVSVFEDMKIRIDLKLDTLLER